MNNQILNYEIGDDFIGVFDTNFDTEFYIEYYKEVQRRNKCFKRNKSTDPEKFPIVKDELCYSMIYPESHTPSGYGVESLQLDHEIVEKYNQMIAMCLHEYSNKFSIIEQIKGVQYGINIQKTLPGEGYHLWHSEIDCKMVASRFIVTMMYLNDVEEGGETEFLYQHRRIKPKKGRVVLWPAQWPHTHRGNPPLSGEKYIATSWIYHS